MSDNNLDEHDCSPYMGEGHNPEINGEGSQIERDPSDVGSPFYNIQTMESTRTKVGKGLRITALERQITQMNEQVTLLLEKFQEFSQRGSPRVTISEPEKQSNNSCKSSGLKHLRLANFKADNAISASDWLNSYTSFATKQGWHDEEKSDNLLYFLESHAIRWYHNVTRDSKLNWYDISTRFLERFGVQDERHFEQLKTLRWAIEKESLQDYYHRALNLTDRETDQKYRCSILSTGLPESYKRHLIFTGVSDVSTWYNLVHKYHIYNETFRQNHGHKQGLRPKHRIASLNDKSKLNQLASQPPVDRGNKQGLGLNSRPRFKPCSICGKTNHSPERCFKRPGYKQQHKQNTQYNNNNNNRNSTHNNNTHNNNNQQTYNNNHNVHSSDNPINKMIEYNEEQYCLENYQLSTVSITDPNRRYAWLNVDDKVRVKALIDSGAKPTAIDYELCKSYNIPIHPQTRTLAHVLESFETKGTAHLIVSNDNFTEQIRADVVNMLGEQLIIGVKDFKNLGYSLQGPGLIAVLDDCEKIATLTDNLKYEAKIMAVKELKHEEELDKILNSHISIFSSHDFDVGHSDLLYCYIHIKPGEKPHAVPPRRLALKLVEEEKEQIKILLQHGLIEPSFSNWAAGITFACREGKQPRLCGDYRVLNTKTLSDKYPIPRIDFIINNLKGAQVYSKLDLTRGYNNIKIAPEDKYKSAFVTNSGLYQWTRMPFGLKNAPAVFQRYMEIVISKCADYAQVYFDDIIVFSKSPSEHLNHLRLLFKELASHNIKLKRPKCIFLSKEITFCGHIIRDGKICRDDSFVKAIDRVKKPTDVKELYQFMGLANYGRNFIANFAEITRPLNLLRRKGADYLWTREQDIAFEVITNKLKEAPSIYLFDPDRETILYTDASTHTIGAILVQLRPDDNDKRGHIEVPVGYYSKSLNETQSRYNIYVKELLSLVKALGFFKEYLYGRHFAVVTDNAALSFFRTSKEIAAVHTRWLMFMEEFDFTISHKPAIQNKAADALSRLVLPEKDVSIHAIIDYDKLYTELAQDAFIKKLPPREISEEQIDYILDYIHKVKFNHAGLNKMENLVRKLIKFPCMGERIRQYLLSCKACRMVNPHSQRMGFVRPMQVPTNPNDRWFIDFIQRLPNVSGYTNIFVAIDHTSRVAVARPVKALDVKSAIDELKRMFHSIGRPKEIVSDNASCFCNDVFAKFLKHNGINHILTPAYYHASNGLVERFNRTLQESIAKYLLEDKNSTWLDHVRPVVQRYNNTVHRVTKATPYQIKMNKVPIQNANRNTTKQQQYDANRLNKSAVTPKLVVGDTVLFANLTQKTLEPKFKQLFKIMRFINPEIVIIQAARSAAGRKIERRAHVSNLKKYNPTNRAEILTAGKQKYNSQV